MNLESLSKEELIKIIKMYAKNWLAHDGSWFLAAEEKFGLDVAIELDTQAWSKFAVTESRRIMKEFSLPENGGLKSLAAALQYRFYATINKQEINFINENKMIFKMIECRVHDTRKKKKLPLFPCKSVGIVEFSQFAKTIDNRIETRCISCPPDDVKDTYCIWEFSIK